MNNKIILSIHHKYSELILTEKKTLEIRKSAPRRGAWGGGAKDTVFLYETKADGGAGAVVGFSLAVLMRQQTLLPCTISTAKRNYAAAL